MRLTASPFVGVRRLHQSNKSHPADQSRRRHRRRQAPAGFLCASDLVALGVPASSAYALLKKGRLGPVHQWRGLLVVKAEAAEEFLAVRPIPVPGEGSAA
jgi:hypothetical protein